jgi:membrane-bound lytic murein transglycosylase D
MNRSKLLVFCALAALVGSAARASDAAAPPDALEAPLAAATTAAGSPGGASPAAAPASAPATSGGTATAALEPAADTPDEPAIEQEVEAESAELEQVRAAEERAGLTDPVAPDDPAARAAARLGLESPLRLRLRDAFGREAGPAPAASTGRIAGLPEIDHDLRHLQAEYDIPIEVNEQVLAYIRFFQAPNVRKHFVKWLGRSSRYMPTFRRILREEGLPEDTVFLAMIESGFANHAASRAKAVGAWQFIAPTGKRMGLRQDFFVDERRDPEKAARAASKYLKELYRQTGDWRLAWAGYNAGVGKIYKARAKGQLDFWAMTRGRVLKAETKGYVPKLMAAAIVTKHHEAFGFTREEIEAERWIEYEHVEIPHATPLAAVADAAGVAEKAILDLNPELRRTCTPPRPYRLKLPKGAGETFAARWPEVSENTGKLAFAQHKVGRGESLKAVAATYRVDVASLVRMNGLKPGRHVKAGTELVVPLNALARNQGVTFASTERAVAQASEKSSRASRRSARRTVLASVEAPAAPRLSSLAGRLRSTVHIRAGDSLWGIAQRFGVAVDELCRWNGIRNARQYKLQVGRELVVYPRRNASASPVRASRGG